MPNTGTCKIDEIDQRKGINRKNIKAGFDVFILLAWGIV
jgi:hypothetical protein